MAGEWLGKCDAHILEAKNKIKSSSQSTERMVGKTGIGRNSEKNSLRITTNRKLWRAIFVSVLKEQGIYKKSKKKSFGSA